MEGMGKYYIELRQWNPDALEEEDESLACFSTVVSSHVRCSYFLYLRGV